MANVGGKNNELRICHICGETTTNYRIIKRKRNSVTIEIVVCQDCLYKLVPELRELKKRMNTPSQASVGADEVHGAGAGEEDADPSPPDDTSLRSSSPAVHNPVTGSSLPVRKRSSKYNLEELKGLVISDDMVTTFKEVEEG